MEKIKRIIFLVRRYDEGTAPMNRLLGYAKGFADLGVEVWFYFLITDAKEEKIVLNDRRIHRKYLWEDNGQLLRKYRIFGLVNNLFKFNRCVKDGDIVFLYGRANYTYFSTSFISKKAHIFCEITEHPNYGRTDLFHRISVSISMFFIKRFRGLFVISQCLRNYFISKGVDKNKICVINMFVDSSRFKSIEKYTDQKIIAYCGSVSRKKDGVDILIQAFSMFSNSHPDYKLYIIGGEGDDESLSYFMELTEKYEVAEKVVFTGKVSSEALPQLLSNASVLALSRPDSIQARNGFPTKLGEYLATGRPVLVTDVGEVPLFIKHGVNGFIAKESDANDFADKLCWIANHLQEAEQVGRQGAMLVNDVFSYQTQSRKALEFMIQKL